MSYPLILSSPDTGALPVGVLNWRGLSIEWVSPARLAGDPDGHVWDLTDPDSGVVLYRKGVEGLHFPRITKNRSRSRAIPGARLRGWRAEEREVFWPIYLWADGSDAWLARQDEFFNSIHPANAGEWRVSAGGETRTLQLTGVFDEPHAYERDPLIRGWSLYDVSLEAQQPFWQGPTMRRGPWRAPDPVPFYSAPPFRISSAASFAAASIPNTGDVDAWGVWWVSGPLEEIELGVGSSRIRVPFRLLAGEMLRIDTDPRRATARLGEVVSNTDAFVGADVTRRLGLQSYASVPPGAEVDLHVTATGSGSVMFDLVPLYFRAFGKER